MKRIALVVCCLAGVAWSAIHGSARLPQSVIALQVPQDPSSVGYLNLTGRHPDGDDGAIEFARQYGTAPALERLEQMRGFLQSFQNLTQRARGKMAAADLRAAGNTSREMQNLGFHNIPLVVEGTLLKQDYQLKQLEYELAQLRRARGELAEPEVERARDAYAAATKRFQVYWDTKRFID